MDLATAGKSEDSFVVVLLKKHIFLLFLLPGLVLFIWTLQTKLAFGIHYGLSSLEAQNMVFMAEWKHWRDIVFVGFTLMFVIQGMILSLFGQDKTRTLVVITQRMIPHEVVGLLLMTFSYALGGVFADVTFTVLHLLSVV